MRFFLAAFALLCTGPIWSATPSPTASEATNAEMTAIFVADQTARDNPATIDWSVVGPADNARRARTQVLLVAGLLKSADDFYHAAYVFQHGDEADDYLKAHALALAAVARGNSKASWIAAATLDRYLQRIGQPQIYGTQFLHNAGKPWTQEPYKRDLLPDTLREATGVPSLGKQQEQLREWARTLP
jgi:hypothetical protein